MIVPRLHPQSILARSPQNEGLYSNLYDKDMSLMRKLMNLDDFQCASNGNSSNITAPNSDINASKQFHSYTNGNSASSGGGIFNGKFTNPTNFGSSFPFDSKQQPHQHQQHLPNGLSRSHEGLLKPCYDHFSSTTTVTNTKSETHDDNFGSSPITGSSNGSGLVGYKKQSSTTTTTSSSLFQSTGGGNVGGFMNQFPHESLFGANNNNHHQQQQHQHQAFTKLNEINNNNSMVIKLENGGNISVGNLSAEQNQNLVSRSSTTMATASTNKTEPNEFRHNSNKDSNSHMDDERKKSALAHDDSNDGFTQL